MTEITFRFGVKRFIDNAKFPYGFSRSGDFTEAESELLTQYGDTMRAIEAGEIEPENAEEKHFLKVLQNPKKAHSKLERVWLKYIQLARGRRRFHTLTSSRKVMVESDSTEDELTEEYDD